MPTRYIKVHRTPPPGESISTRDLKDLPLIAVGDVPTAEWQVEDEDGQQKRMSGQQILDLVSGGTPGTGGSGRPAEIEIEDTADGIRIRGKSGDAANFGPWFTVRDGRNAEIEIEDIVGGIRVRGKSGGDAEFGAWHEVRDGRDGRDGRDATGSTQFDGFQDVYAPGGKVLTLGGKVVSFACSLTHTAFCTLKAIFVVFCSP